MSAQPLNEFPDTSELGANWRVQFLDDQGNMLAMDSFNEIDFGAISYKEVFQNVKTILATPKLSCPLERLLGVDGSIVDLPVNKASEMTVAILEALTYWEPRCQVMSVAFSTDLNGHLIVSLQLNIRNVIYGTTTAYDQTSILAPMEAEDMSQGPQGPPGPQGPQGPAGPQGPSGLVAVPIAIPITGGLIGADVIPVTIVGFTAAPSHIMGLYFEKASPTDDTVTVVSLDSITSAGFNCNLSAPAIAGQVLHISVAP